MKITRVEAHLLSYPFDEPLKLFYFGGERTILKRDAMLIRVETDKGLTGYAPGQPTERAKKLVELEIGSFLAGRTLADADALRVLFMKEYPGREDIAKVYCSVEIALYDLIGKAKGL